MSSRITEVLQGREENYILPFLWQHGEEEEMIREEMARVHESGIGAVCIEARPHPDFLGPKWWLDMDIIMDEARKRGMKVWLLDDDHFPTGHAAGKVKEAPEELHRKFLGERYVDTVGPAPGASLLVDTLLMTGLRPTISLRTNASGRNKLISVTAVRRDPVSGALLSESIDLTDRIQAGIVYWDIPEGYWRVFVISEDNQGGSEKQADYLNPLDRASVRILLDTVYEAIYERYKDDFGQTFAGFFSDEPGFYNDKTTFDFESRPGKAGVSLPWSSDMPPLLEQALGGDYRNQLHLLWHDAGEQSDRVRYSYMNIVSRLYAENFCNQLGDWCRARGVEYIGHVLEDNNVHARLGPGAGHFFRSMWGQDMSGLDVVLWQIVPGFDEISFRSASGVTDSEFFHYGLAKLGVSLGHIDPKKQGRTMCEVYGAYGWTEGLKLMKWLTDHMLVRGVNRFVPHAFTQKPFPDPDCGPHMYAGGKNPQYRYYGYLNRYINRISHLISGGRHVATAAVLYHGEAEWSGEAMYFHKPVRVLLQHQIDCEVLPADILLDEAKVKDSKLHVNLEEYQCLIIPYAEALPAELLRQLADYAGLGLPVYFVDGLPVRSSEGTDVSAALSFLSACPNVKISGLKGLADMLTAAGYYEIKADGYEPYLRNYHYVHEDSDVFMFFNESPHKVISTKVTLPLAGEGAVYGYDAFRNQLTLMEPSGESGAATVELELHPYESIVLLYGAVLADCSAERAWTADGPELTLQGEWTVSTAVSESYPAFDAPVTLKTLQNMSAPDLLPEFSGTFRYETEFEWEDSADSILLELGEVYETAEAWINGQPAGLCICPPYRMEVTGAIRQGTNTLVVEVTNTLAKDQQDFLSAFAQQDPSGLIGPVTVTPLRRLVKEA
ncbi:glycosylhydrolase-like jelly roll fold domain-containing protein [Paenibacillus sp. FSL R7-0345]|uniref:glycosylhydrolase-like jelly roll fold domain-containing protein n=1 Tax=Paenibacillus sp. FSL R7-0345 TaxID=2954535 RepID=UPI00315A7705